MDFEDLDIESADSVAEAAPVIISQSSAASVIPNLSETVNDTISHPIQANTNESGLTVTEYNSIGEKYWSALTAARSPEEHDALVEMFKAELNTQHSTLLKLGLTENGIPLTGSTLFQSITSGEFLGDPQFAKSFVDSVQYNLEINLGPTNIASVPSVLDEWEFDNSYYLAPDEFGIDRKFKNGIMVPEDSDKVSELHIAFENAFHDALSEVQGCNNSPLPGTGGGNEADSEKIRQVILKNTRNKVADWALSLVGSTSYAQTVALRNYLVGSDKCNVFVGDSFIIGAGVDNYPHTITLRGNEYPVPVDWFLKWPDERMGAFIKVESPMPGDIAVFPITHNDGYEGGHLMVVVPAKRADKQFVGGQSFDDMDFVGAGEFTVNERSLTEMYQLGFKKPVYWRYDGQGVKYVSWPVLTTLP